MGEISRFTPMLKVLPLWVGALFGLIQPRISSSDDSAFWSIQAPVKKADLIKSQIERNYPLKSTYQKRDLYRMVQGAIAEANPKQVGLEPKEGHRLSRQVVHTAQCYGVDPVVFTALIWRESNFKPNAESETGAVGLTQMTTSGVHEVLDRLDLNSFRKLKHLRTLVKRCSPEMYSRLPLEVSADIVAAWKNNVAFSNADALVMGVLLLKLHLASRVHSIQQTKVYLEALERYNGDPKIKVRFAQDVMQLAKRMSSLPEIALNDSKFLSLIQGF